MALQLFVNNSNVYHLLLSIFYRVVRFYGESFDCKKS